MLARSLRNLTYFVLAAAFLLGTTYAYANHPVRAAITPSVHQMQDAGMSCSVVMIAPERALTAAHCLGMESPVVTIDGYNYTVTEGYANSPRDIAILIIEKVTGKPFSELVRCAWRKLLG